MGASQCPRSPLIGMWRGSENLRRADFGSRHAAIVKCWLSCVRLSLHRDEPLYPLAGEHLTRVDVAFGVHGDHVQAEELAAVFAHLTHLAQDLAIQPVEEPVVVSV